MADHQKMSFKKEYKNTTTDQKLNGRISKQELDQKKKKKNEKKNIKKQRLIDL